VDKNIITQISICCEGKMWRELKENWLN
jgi:hypothetical protein